MKIRPLNDRIIVRRIEADSTTPGGIIIPENAKDLPQRGVVLAVGNGKALDDGSRRELSVKQGEEILFTKYGGQEVEIDGDKLLIVSESDVLGIVEGD